MRFEIYKTSDNTDANTKAPQPCMGAVYEPYPTVNWPKGHRWFIDIETIQDIENLRKEVGTELVITDSIWAYPLPAIEIYDDYRE
jgi:hypothetical protein